MIPNSKLTFRTPNGLPKYPNIVVGGGAGVGKTAFLGSAGPDAKVLIADPEQGTVSFQSAWFLAQPTSVKQENIHVIDFDDVTTSAELVHRVEGALDHLIRTKNSDGYALFALDSITEFQERFIRLHTASDPRQAYGALKEAMHTLTIKARQAPVVTIFTARLRAITDEVSQREMVRPEVSPGVWSVTSGLFDQIGLFDLRVQGVTARRTLDFSLKPRFPGKDRFGLGEIPDPTMMALLAKLNRDPSDAPVAPARPRPAAAAARR